ncbi:hypothetical protein HC766_04475 [Candidatus Gracilibacteria bacterium]|nr:hypothetical protein [Candidatus Gracilibacteria bacterium]
MEAASLSFVVRTAKELKKEFRKIETQPWTSYAYSMEIIVQVGHLADIFLRQEYKYNPHSKNENQTRINDEVCDVILNLLFLYIELYEEVELSKINNVEVCMSKESLFTELALSCAQLTRLSSTYFDSNQSKADIKNMLEYTLGLSISLADACNCDLISNFLRIKSESQIYIEKKSN